MEQITWQVTENSSGGLALYVWEGEIMVFAHVGYEKSDLQLLRDKLAQLQRGVHPIPADWENNDLYNEQIIKGIRNKKYDYESNRFKSVVTDQSGIFIPLTNDEYYDDRDSTEVICDEDGPVDKEDMGIAGQRVFYP